ncbi:MAG: chloride channel protein [Candidatus Lokiarchaeota archaeon]|nr:chloride channel protein [Candidatus Lokiarchaeota archaeon]
MKRLRRSLLISFVVGIISGLGAIIFFFVMEFLTALLLGSLGGYHTPSSIGEPHLFNFSSINSISWQIPVLLTCAGLVTGIIVYKFAPEAEGHGTDAYISAFHYKQGKIRGRVPLVKAVASAIVIGAGGSAGREGPIAQIGSGFGSVLATRLHLNDKDRRIAVICGAAGGIGAIFKSPFGGALFAIEVLYKRDIESDAIIPAFLSSTIAYSLFGLVYGFNPIFFAPEFTLDIAILLLYGLLGIICAIVAKLFIVVFNYIRKVFKKLKLPNIYKPAIGMGLSGLLALYFPYILGPGYGWIQDAIFGNIGLIILLIFVFAKIIATSLVIGSGGSGGVFAPSLVIGGMIGASFIGIIHLIFPNAQIEVGAFVIVGMAAFITGIANILICPIIMVSEMTGTYTLLVPAMLACVFSYIFSLNWSIYESQVPTKADSPVHRGDFASDILDNILVEEVMTTSFLTLNPQDNLKKYSDLLLQTDYLRFFVVEDDQLIGIISYKDILKVPIEALESTTVSDIMTKEFETIYPNANLSQALTKIKQHGILAVLDLKTETKLIGILSKQDIVRGHNIARNKILQRDGKKKSKNFIA